MTSFRHTLSSIGFYSYAPKVGSGYCGLKASQLFITGLISQQKLNLIVFVTLPYFAFWFIQYRLSRILYWKSDL